MFGRNRHEAVDRQMKEAMLKPLTAENLNCISDLYLRKGEKDLAVACLYDAITKLHVSQRDKMIAIFKKIIKLAPGDENAYKGMIDVFAKMGLVAEEVNHLILLAKIYQSRGDYEKINELYRRIHLIDPDNETVAKHFGKGKSSGSEVGEKEGGVEFRAASAILSGHPEIGEPTGIVPAGGSPEVAQDEMRIEMQEAWNSSRTQDTMADEVPAAQEDWCAASSPPVSHNKRVYLLATITVLLILCVVAAGFMVYKKVRGGMNSSMQRPEMAAAPQDAVGMQKEVGALKISVMQMTGSLIDESGLGKAVGQRALAANRFYSLTLQSEQGCIPEEVARDPLSRISFVGENGGTSGTTSVKGLELLNRTVYKAIVSGCGENKAVFMKLFIAHPKEHQYKGIAVQRMEKGATETITWD